MRCCVKNCKNSTKKSRKGVSMHRFPKDPDLRNQWIFSLKTANPSPVAVVCSDHFPPTSIIRFTNKNVLIGAAVPYIIVGDPESHNSHKTLNTNSQEDDCIQADQITIKDEDTESEDETTAAFQPSADQQSVQIPQSDKEIEHIWLENASTAEPIPLQHDRIKSLIETELAIDDWDAEPFPDDVLTRSAGFAMPLQSHVQPNHQTSKPKKYVQSTMNPETIRNADDVKRWTIHDIRKFSIEHIWQGLQLLLKEHDKLRIREHSKNTKLRRSSVKLSRMKKKIVVLEDQAKITPAVMASEEEPHRLGDLETMASRVYRFGFKVGEACRFCFKMVDSMLELNEGSEINMWFKQLTKDEIVYGHGIPTKVCTSCYQAIGEHAAGTSGLREVNRKWKIRSEIYEKHAPTGQDLALVCYECGKIFQQSRSLYNHRNSVHPPSEPGTCPTCNKEFKNQLRLSIHMLRHNEKRFVCEICGHAVHMKKDITNHMICKHNMGERPPAQKRRIYQFRCTGIGCSYMSDDRAKCDAHILRHGKNVRDSLLTRSKRRTKAEIKRARGEESETADVTLRLNDVRNSRDDEEYSDAWMLEQLVDDAIDLDGLQT